MNYYIYILFSESSGIECGDDRGQAMVIERFIKKQQRANLDEEHKNDILP